MKIRYLLFAILTLRSFLVFPQDPVFELIKTELDRNFSVFKEKETPAYYIYLRMEESKTWACNARLGRLQSTTEEPYTTRYLSSMVRVGNSALDNTHEIREAEGGGKMVDVSAIPIDQLNSKLIKNTIWLQLDNLYKDAVQTYDKLKANIAVKVGQEDKSPDFTEEIAEKYYEAPLNFNLSKDEMKLWEKRLKKYSAIFSQNKDILGGSATFYQIQTRKWFVDTEGREIAQNVNSYHLVLSANIITDDGMDIPLYKTWVIFDSKQLPSEEEIVAAANQLSRNLSELKKAPIAESFSGPAILSPEASGVFFHEIFGHRVEGARMKQEQDAQTFKKKIGEYVLPKHMSVTFDPTIKSYKNMPLHGFYVYDDEGIKSQRVEVVQKGILRDFLMCRTPIEGFLKSNGHGRAQMGARAVSRQSNMLIESSRQQTEDQLRKMLIKEAKAQKKDYGYYFKEVSGGFTTTGRYMPNAFNVSPLMVYRIYVDGRPDELVRGVDLVGTPLAMFSQIEACGTEYAAFNGTCGAESGRIPVSCVSPSIFVKRIETQKRTKKQSQPPILSKPISNKAVSTSDNIISDALKTEVERALDGLKMDGLKPPFFISYGLKDSKNLSIKAQSGGIVRSAYYPDRSSTCRLLIGDYQCTDENFLGSVEGLSGYDGSPCIENNEEGIRYTVWRDLDAIYKRATETYEQKISTIKQLNIPASDLELPDWDKTPMVQLSNLPEPDFDFNKEQYEQYAREISAVFNDYKDIINSEVSLQIEKSSIYFYNTEKSEYRLPHSHAYIFVMAVAMTNDGERVGDGLEYIFSNPKDFPPLEKIQSDCRKLAEKVLAKKESPIINEAYTGPVLFENKAVMETFFSNFFGEMNSLIAKRKPLSSSGYAYGGNSIEEMMNKRITAKEISIEDLTGAKEYNGIPLVGYTPVDAQGVIPSEKLVLVENGILKTLLSDRVPTQKVPHSNGHSLFGLSLNARTGTGNARMSDTRKKPNEELRRQLFDKAKEEGYDYTYIVKQTTGGGSTPTELYRINIKDGSEQLIRSATVNNMDDQVFKKIIAVSDKETIHNTIFYGLTSIIAPEAILFEEMSIQKDMLDNYKKPPIVPQPE